jgi:hypothetical protein
MSRYVEVDGVTATDWQLVLDYIRGQAGDLVFTVNGAQADLPGEAATILALLADATPEIAFRIGEVPYVWCVWVPETMSFSLCPTIYNASQFEGLCGFAARLGAITGKPAEITYEGFGRIGRYCPAGGTFEWYDAEGQPVQHA